MRITLFMPCFNDVLFPGTGVSTVRVLESLGHEVVFPGDQTCCGQIHFNTGYRTEATSLLRHFLEVFGGSELVVAPSASCVAMVREQYPELAAFTNDADLQTTVGEIAGRTFELTEFLVDKLGVVDLGAHFPYRVVFHPTCHSIRSIDVGDAPLRLLRAVRGLEFQTLEGDQECCGFGGTFAVKNPHTSLAMMEDKIRNVAESGAEVLTAVDNSCLLHLAGGMRRRGLLAEGPVDGSHESRTNGGIRIMHLAEILAAREGGFES
jgi:L-lactate dehydrogenase complex protein LldE